MDEIWKDRKDFKVYTTLTDFRKEWNEAVEIENRDEYKEWLTNTDTENYRGDELGGVEYYKRKLRKINQLPKIGLSWISTRLDLGKDKSIELEELLPIFKRKNLSCHVKMMTVVDFCQLHINAIFVKLTNQNFEKMK